MTDFPSTLRFECRRLCAEFGSTSKAARADESIRFVGISQEGDRAIEGVRDGHTKFDSAFEPPAREDQAEKSARFETLNHCSIKTKFVAVKLSHVQ